MIHYNIIATTNQNIYLKTNTQNRWIGDWSVVKLRDQSDHMLSDLRCSRSSQCLGTEPQLRSSLALIDPIGHANQPVN